MKNRPFGSIYERVRSLIAPASDRARAEQARLELIPGGKERRRQPRIVPEQWHEPEFQQVLDAQHRASTDDLPPDSAA